MRMGTLFLTILFVSCSWDRLYGGWVQLIAADGSTILSQQQITSAIGAGSQTLYFESVPNVHYIKDQLTGEARALSLAEVRAVGFVKR